MNTTRRGILGALATAPMLAAIPALGAPTGSASFAAAHARYIATGKAINAAPEHLELTDPETFRILEDRYSDGVDGIDNAVPSTWNEFVLKLEATIADGVTPGREGCNRLIAEARRLAAGGFG